MRKICKKMFGGEAKDPSEEPMEGGLPIFNPSDSRSSDDIMGNILEMAGGDIRDLRTVNRVFGSGGARLMPWVIQVQHGGDIQDLDDAIRRLRLIRARRPNDNFEIHILDTDSYIIGNDSINGTILREMSHRVDVMATSDYQGLQQLPQDLQFRIITPEIEVNVDFGFYDVNWKGGDIPPVCFRNCRRLRNFQGDNVTSIGVEALAGCVNMHIILSPRLRTIHARAFTWAGASRGNWTLVMPQSLAHIGDRAFNASGVNHIIFNSQNLVLEEGAFINCYDLLSVGFPQQGQIHIGEMAFLGCPRLYSADITPAIRSVQRRAFAECEMLEDVNIEGNAEIAEDAYADTPFRMKRRCGDMGSCVLQLRF